MDVSPKQTMSRGGRADPVPRARRRQPRPDGLATCSARRCRCSSRRRRWSARAWRSAPRATRARSPCRRSTAWSRASPASRSSSATTTASCTSTRLRKFIRTNQGTCINQRPIVVRGQRVARGPAAGRLVVDRRGRAGARPERAGGVHELGGRQLRRRHPALREAGARRHVHLDPHREARGRSARHQARPRRDHPRHPERRRGQRCATSTRTGSSASAPRSRPATSWSARSRRRARPS